MSGILEVIGAERNFRIHLGVFFLVIVCGVYMKLSAMEWCLILIVSSLVMVAEMLNSAIERLIDYLKPEIHPAAKSIKDIAAGSVLLAVISAVAVGCIIFIPKIALLFTH
ncbi:diacylglycerol kinase family protein [Virgibacillus sp. 179-BFC.A HS]|uniref:Diacylglycerol kinase family protein n=1 Tax=Tigheibacillus jepli TaxID=3035914 RepID=A0ABU5CGT0_9BACI|nr:diacylglycerol kinase family protein [Virgibacillus sp. 179-BFC.A HS]MDY0405542.1 diacylglycerol kinase family protein [Virgibacillus sp. 179-BFC.A HS]